METHSWVSRIGILICTWTRFFMDVDLQLKYFYLCPGHFEVSTWTSGMRCSYCFFCSFWQPRCSSCCPNLWPNRHQTLGQNLKIIWNTNPVQQGSQKVIHVHTISGIRLDHPRSSAAQRLIGDGHFGFLRCFDDVNGGIRDLLRKCWAKKFQKQKQPGWKAMRDVGHGQSFSLKKTRLVEVCWIMLN